MTAKSDSLALYHLVLDKDGFEEAARALFRMVQQDGIWNDFHLPLYYLNNSAYWPMTLAVYNFFGQFQQDWNLVSADIVLTVIPVLIIYLIGQRFILSGLTAGAVKG